ncbi:hypothetical protein BKA82DRAFT_4014735 [Pisolithus tinctorius]|nr:hypothetical protein BKA82DRAFT_4021677 [Pisolithus tinctorius]KAI6142392.1 hypothetical protein BKA82DRAFT_4018121 [Pisolithus tinctorius]KAI6148783.1 hypothetical protein BKA82DRAFT_4014735 [Pisolithus tinctorius]
MFQAVIVIMWWWWWWWWWVGTDNGRGILIEQTLKPTFGCLQDLSSTQAEPNAFTPLLPLGFVRLPLHFDSSPLAVSEFVRGGSDHAWDNHWQEQQDEDEGEPQL